MSELPELIVYCSGPLFCPEEVASMTALARALEADGCQTFLPHRDGLESYLLGQVNRTGRLAPQALRRQIDRAIFALDVFQIVERCDCLIYNLNGRVPDEGGAVEAGIAFACGKPVVLYKSDVRSAFAGRDNSMIVGLSRRKPIAEVAGLAPAVRECLASRARAPAASSVSAPPELAASVRQGGRIWRLLERRPGGARSMDAELMLPIEQIVAAAADP